MSDLVSCLEDYALPLMQFSEAFAVVQVRFDMLSMRHALPHQLSRSNVGIFSWLLV